MEAKLKKGQAIASFQRFAADCCTFASPSELWHRCNKFGDLLLRSETLSGMPG